jgi:hypothetical protein
MSRSRHARRKPDCAFFFESAEATAFLVSADATFLRVGAEVALPRWAEAALPNVHVQVQAQAGRSGTAHCFVLSRRRRKPNFLVSADAALPRVGGGRTSACWWKPHF